MNNKTKSNWSVLIGAAFLMGTSAIGPGFLTQTATFTEQLGASFGFAILISLILTIGAQLNVWRVIAVSKRYGQDVANMVVPGLGYLVSFMVVLGGLAFNIANVGGAGLGLQVMSGLSVEIGAIMSALLAVIIFLFKEAGRIMDKFVQLAGIMIILLMAYVAFRAQPPVLDAVRHTFLPTTIDFYSIITLVGGTVGGYITFAGAHRLLESGISGESSLKQVTQSAMTGILVTAIMRIMLFLVVLGVVSQGIKLDAHNPVASVFESAAGVIGYKVFGGVMWAAAITSIVGAAYTSVTFLRIFHKKIAQYQNQIIIAFIVFSAVIFIVVGRPAQILVLVGAINGLILPLVLAPILIAAHKKSIMGTYKHPLWLTIFGGIVVVLMAYLGVYTALKIFIA